MWSLELDDCVIDCKMFVVVLWVVGSDPKDKFSKLYREEIVKPESLTNSWCFLVVEAYRKLVSD